MDVYNNDQKNNSYVKPKQAWCTPVIVNIEIDIATFGGSTNALEDINSNGQLS